MATTAARATAREPLSRARVLRSAIDLADREGLPPLSMRRLGQELGVEAMSLYHHVANKEDLFDGMAETVVTDLNAEVGPGPRPGQLGEAGWVGTLRLRILTAREVMLRHKWAPALIESRTSLSPALIAYYEGVLATLRAGGFSYDLAHHTLHALGSKALGFSQELFDPVGDTGAQPDVDIAAMSEHFPHLVGMLGEIVHEGPETTLGWCDDQTEFEFGLDVLLDGLERRRTGVTSPRDPLP